MLLVEYELLEQTLQLLSPLLQAILARHLQERLVRQSRQIDVALCSQLIVELMELIEVP